MKPRCITGFSGSTPSVTNSWVATRTRRHSSEPTERCEIAAGTSAISPGVISTIPDSLSMLRAAGKLQIDDVMIRGASELRFTPGDVLRRDA